MRRITRLLTICLLLMAIPVKGAVAASMVMCGPGHERMTTVIAAEPAKTAEVSGALQHGDHASHGHSSHDHASHGHASNVGSEHAHAAAPSDYDTFDKHGAVKCSICAACCVGGAFLVPADALVPASAGTEAPFPAVFVRFPGFVLAGLERPPRTFPV